MVDMKTMEDIRGEDLVKIIISLQIRLSVLISSLSRFTDNGVSSNPPSTEKLGHLQFDANC